MTDERVAELLKIQNELASRQRTQSSTAHLIGDDHWYGTNYDL